MENEIMNYEETVMEPEIDLVEMDDTKSGIGTGKALLIGAGVALAITAGVKLAKDLWAKHKAKKELRLVDEDDTVEVADEQIEEVTKK